MLKPRDCYPHRMGVVNIVKKSLKKNVRKRGKSTKVAGNKEEKIKDSKRTRNIGLSIYRLLLTFAFWAREQASK